MKFQYILGMHLDSLLVIDPFVYFLFLILFLVIATL